MKTLFALLFAALLSGCGGGADDSADGRWRRERDIAGPCCNYASIVVTDNAIRVYTNTAADGRLGDMTLYENGTSRTVLHIDAPDDTFIRTLAVVERDGKYVALLETGDAYPGTNGYSPSWATSDDGIDWSWHGPVSPYPRTLSSGGALTVDQAGNFRAWLDINGVFKEMRSVNGMNWTHFGSVAVPGDGLFSSAAHTPTGTLLAVADTWPSNRITTLWQCHGQEWQVLEGASPIHNGEKGTALTYHAGLIHAYANGKHWTTPAPACQQQG